MNIESLVSRIENYRLAIYKDSFNELVQEFSGIVIDFQNTIQHIFQNDTIMQNLCGELHERATKISNTRDLITMSNFLQHEVNPILVELQEQSIG